MDLHSVPGSSNSVFYISDFVSKEEERHLVRKILESPRQNWKQLSNRRLQVLGGQVTKKHVLIPQAMPAYISTYPDILERLESTGVFQNSPHNRPNHILLNEYLPGQGIMPHEDGPAYHPVVATISLGSHTVLNFYRYLQQDGGGEGKAIDPTPILSLLLEPRSVVITTSKFYIEHLHGIDNTGDDVFNSATDDKGVVSGIANLYLLGDEQTRRAVQEGGTLRRGTRYSLTCRDVARVATFRGI